MSTTNDPRIGRAAQPGSRPARDGLFRFTVEQFYELGERGYFDDRHVELIGGMIYEMTAKPPHVIATELTHEVLRRWFSEGCHVRTQHPFDVDRHNMPEPDHAVVPGSIRDYTKSHPREALLIVEVSDATLRKDRVLKAHVYARAGVPEYWIVNLVDRQLEVHRDPGPDPARRHRFRYQEVTIVPADGHASPLARPEVRIAVADMLP